ncbi:MAG: hypothetical protein JXO22_06125 [Phycisphaerae bacterium]|nr:hypothetical protein [Phycisphaerae bacterium]
MIGTMRHLVGVVMLAGAVLTLVGCQAGEQRQPAVGEPFDASTINTRDDITQVNSFCVTPPWLRDEGRVVGFRARAYLVSAATGRGVFVPGDILVTVHKCVADRSGVVTRVPVHEWTLDEKAAMGFRVTKRTLMGYSYGLILRWPDELNLMGEVIEITIKYRRTDGVIIPSPPKQFRVE